MLVLQIAAQKPQDAVPKFLQALARAKKEYGLSDMPAEVEAMLAQRNTFIGNYSDAKTGRVYHRLLVKGEDGRFFDYRMYPDLDDRKAWFSEEEWKRKLGLDPGRYSISISQLSQPKAEPPGWRAEDRMAFLKSTVKAAEQDNTRMRGPQKPAEESGGFLESVILKKSVRLSEPAEAKKEGPPLMLHAETLKDQKVKSGASKTAKRKVYGNQHRQDFERELLGSPLDATVIRSLVSEEAFVRNPQTLPMRTKCRLAQLPVAGLEGGETGQPSGGLRYLPAQGPAGLVPAQGYRLTVLRPYTTVRDRKHPVEREIGFQGLFERLSEVVADREGNRVKVISLIDKYAKMYGVPLQSAVTLFATESLVIKEAKSSSACLGYGQISPRTAADIRDKEGSPVFELKKGTDGKPLKFMDEDGQAHYKLLNKGELFDAEKNIHASIIYFSEMLGRFKGDLPMALAAYNSGSKSVLNFYNTGRFITEHGNNPRVYAMRGSQFHKFFVEIGVDRLAGMPAGDFMASPEYLAGQARLEAYSKGKKGYLSESS